MRSTCTREHIRLSTQRFPREQRAGDLEFRFIVAILDLCLT
jgi:hypothetical protein